MKQEIEHLIKCFGFTTEELIKMMEEQGIDKEKQKELLPIMKENYDGYRFSIKGKDRIYNSNMCLYFLNQYSKYKEFPESLIDVNIASDYSKLSNMLELCENESKIKILEKSISGNGITTEIIEEFNPEKGFGDREFVSMLFYLGYLTIIDNVGGYATLGIPNKVIKELYSQYFLEVMAENLKFKNSINYAEIWKEVSSQGKINLIIEIVQKYLKNLSNRDYIKFDEKYVKIIFYCIVMNLKDYSIKSEPEVNREYPDLLLVPRDRTKGYKSIMIEFKYLKIGEKNILEEKKKEAKEQIERYSNYEEIKDIQELHKYTVVAINDKLYIDEIM